MPWRVSRKSSQELLIVMTLVRLRSILAQKSTLIVEKPQFSIGLISFCADQFCSVCSPMQRLLLYMYLSQLMSTFTNYLKVLILSMVTSSSDQEEPVIQQSHMYLLIHLCPKIRIHNGYHFPVISFSILASFQ